MRAQCRLVFAWSQALFASIGAQFSIQENGNPPDNNNDYLKGERVSICHHLLMTEIKVKFKITGLATLDPSEEFTKIRGPGRLNTNDTYRWTVESGDTVEGIAAMMLADKYVVESVVLKIDSTAVTTTKKKVTAQTQIAELPDVTSQRGFLVIKVAKRLVEKSARAATASDMALDQPAAEAVPVRSAGSTVTKHAQASSSSSAAAGKPSLDDLDQVGDLSTAAHHYGAQALTHFRVEFVAMVFIALVEEFRVFIATVGRPKRCRVVNNATVHVFDVRGIEVGVCCLDDMGTAGMASLVSRVLADMSAAVKFVFSIGISGTATPDECPIGSVVVPKTCWLYDERKKAVGGGVLQVRPGKKREQLIVTMEFELMHHPAIFSANDAVSTWLTSEQYSSWRASAIADNTRRWLVDYCEEHSDLNPTATEEQVAELTARRPKVMSGTIATGDAVLKCKKAMDTLVTLNPELVAVDMESGAVCKAANSLGFKDVFAIRGISDHADEKKSETEAKYADSNRYWAMRNATEVFLSVFPLLLR